MLRDVFASPMLAGMPPGTTFGHEAPHGALIAWLHTPGFGVSNTLIAATEVNRLTANEPALLELITARLRELRMDHWLAYFWPDLDVLP